MEQRVRPLSCGLQGLARCLLCHSGMLGGEEEPPRTPHQLACQKCVFMRTPYPYQYTSASSKLKNEVSADNLTVICDVIIHLSGVNRSVNVFWCFFASWGTLTARQQCLTYTSAFLLGFGCSKTSVCFMILSVQSLVFSARTKRFSKWASNSVFSA